MRFYLIRNSYWSSIEATAVMGFRFGYTGFGIAMRPEWMRKSWSWLPLFRLSIACHSGSCDQRWIFKVQSGRHWLGYLTRGDATPEHEAFYTAGWQLK